MRNVACRALLIPALAGTALLAFCLYVFSDNKADVDLWGNAGFVTAPCWSPDFHRSNTFSFTEPRAPWINHEWLAQLCLHAAYARFGAPGMLGTKLLLGLAVAGMLYAAVARQTRSHAVRLLYLLLTFSTMGYGYSTRPHHFTYLLLSLFLLCLQRMPPVSPWIVLVFPAAMILWANLHGAFFVGLLALAVYLGAVVFTPWRRRFSRRDLVLLGTAAVASAVATLVNPYGLRLWDFVLRSGAVIRPYLSEWAPFHPLRDAGDHADFMALTVLVLAGAVTARRRLSPPQLALVAASLASALWMRRNIPVFAIVAAFAAPGWLAPALAPRLDAIGRRLPVAVRVGALALLAAGSLLAAATLRKARPAQIEIPPERFPVQTVAFMKANAVEGNLLAFFDWAEYGIWHLYPSCRTFLDGRFLSAYGPGTIRDYLAFLYAEDGWERALTAYPTDMVLLHGSNPAVRLMETRPGWSRAHAAGPAVLYLRDDRHGRILQAVREGRALYPDVPQPWLFP